MSFSIDHILNGNLSTIIEYLNDTPIIENFQIGGITANNKSTTLTDTQIKNLAESTKYIDKSTMITNSAKLLKSVINNVVSKNQSSLLQALVASNNISMDGATIAGDLNLVGNQDNVIDLSGNVSFAQKVQNEITTQINEEVNKTFKNAAMNSAVSGTSTNIGETLGKAMDAVSSLGTSFIDGAAKILDGSLSINSGNKTTKETKTSTENNLKDTFRLNESFTLTTNDDFNNAVSNQLSTVNLASCAQNTNAINNINFSNIKVGGNVNLNIDQKNVVNAALDCVFSQDVCYKLAEIFVTNYDNLVDLMLHNSTSEQTGDILAAGTAAATMVSAAGGAVSEATQGIGSGIKNASEGLGSMFGAAVFMNPCTWICCCICLLIILPLVLYFIFKGSSGEGNGGEGNGGEGNGGEGNGGEGNGGEGNGGEGDGGEGDGSK
jgi:hypothetical protein